METTFLGLALAHPWLGYAMCVTTMVLGYFGWRCCQRVCLMMERCLPKDAAAEKAALDAEAIPEYREEEPAEVVPAREMELRSALKMLGYRNAEIDKVTERLNMGQPLPVLIKQALRELPNRARAS